jgi:hypothetical protein
VQRASEDRLTISEAIEAVGKMIAGYANRGSADKSYIGAIAALLCEYPRGMALRCADPVRGVVLETPFMPTPHDIAKWMEPHFERMRSIERLERMQLQAEQQLQDRREYDAKRNDGTRPTYEELKAKYGPNWGIGQGPETKKWHDVTLDEVRAKYGAAKVDAVPDAAPGAWQKLGRDFRLEPTPARELPEDQMPPVPF